jgi:hypothetical protein
MQGARCCKALQSTEVPGNCQWHGNAWSTGRSSFNVPLDYGINVLWLMKCQYIAFQVDLRLLQAQTLASQASRNKRSGQCTCRRMRSTFWPPQMAEPAEDRSWITVGATVHSTQVVSVANLRGCVIRSRATHQLLALAHGQDISRLSQMLYGGQGDSAAYSLSVYYFGELSGFGPNQN